MKPAASPARGMTLLELLVAVAIFSIVLAGVYDLVRLGAEGVKKGDAEATVAQELEVAVAALRADLRAAQVDSEAGHALSLAPGGQGIVFPRALPGGPGGRPVLAALGYRLDTSGARPRLMRHVGPLPGEPGSASVPVEDEEVSRGISAVKFTIYTRRFQSDQLSYSTRLHSDYAALLARVELSATEQGLTRDLVTSVALQPFTKSQLDPYWNPVTPP